jgi:hypothetical protein
MPPPITKFRGRIDRGKICLDPPGKECLAALIARLEGKEITLTLKRWAKQRSSPANRYYWGVVIAMFAEHLGYDVPEELHHELKRKFLAVDPDAALVKVRSTADLTDVEFREYVEQVRRLAAEYSCPIPGPNEVEF